MIGPDLSRVQHDAHSLLVEQVIFNNKILLPLYTSYIEKFYTLAGTVFFHSQVGVIQNVTCLL